VIASIVAPNGEKYNIKMKFFTIMERKEAFAGRWFGVHPLKCHPERSVKGCGIVKNMMRKNQPCTRSRTFAGRALRASEQKRAAGSAQVTSMSA
jgi:hypothetical protein